jgi:hypothetical protein
VSEILKLHFYGELRGAAGWLDGWEDWGTATLTLTRVLRPPNKPPRHAKKPSTTTITKITSTATTPALLPPSSAISIPPGEYAYLIVEGWENRGS